MKSILHLAEKKRYKLETCHLAVHVMDRYLNLLGSASYPNLIVLATTAVLIAAKQKEKLHPNFHMTMQLLPEKYLKTVTKQRLLDLEF